MDIVYSKRIFNEHFSSVKTQVTERHLSGDISGIGVFVVVDICMIEIDGRFPLHYFIGILVNGTELGFTT
jgi:hypothetical protein